MTDTLSPSELNGRWGADRLSVSRSQVVAAATYISVLQIYLGEVGGSSINGTYILTVVLLFLVDWSRDLAKPLVAATVLLVIAQAVSLVWSPNLSSGLREIMAGLIFVTTLGGLIDVIRRSPDRAMSIVRRYCAVAGLQSLAVIVFRLAPEVERQFYLGGWSGALISEKVLSAYRSGAGLFNIASPDKAGGLLMAANVAGAWAVITLTLTLVSYSGRPGIWRALLLLLHLGAALLCGSKATLAILLGSIPLYLVAIAVFKSSRADRRLLVLVLSVSLIVAAIASFAIDPESLLDDRLSSAVRSRQVMWQFAADQLGQVPLSGHGFGGWQSEFHAVGERFREIGSNGDLAPHNMFLVVWSQSGLIAVVIFAVVIGLGLVTVMKSSLPPHLRALVLCGYVGYVLQSLGENYALYSDAHLSVPLALLLALALQVKPDDFGARELVSVDRDS